MAKSVSIETTDARRIGFLADTHCRRPDGSDLPDAAREAFRGCGLLVHLGDVGQKGVLDRLREIAPVLTPKRGEPMVLEAGPVRIGLTFDATKPGTKIAVTDSGLDLLGNAFEDVLASRFGGPVHAMAFGGTHRAMRTSIDGVVVFNPGSPTLPSDAEGEDDLGSVAILRVERGRPAVEVRRLRGARPAPQG